MNDLLDRVHDAVAERYAVQREIGRKLQVANVLEGSVRKAASRLRVIPSEEALRCLDQAIRNGFGHREWLGHDTDLDPIREDSRSQTLLQAR